MGLYAYSNFLSGLGDFGEYRGLSGAALIFDIMDEEGLPRGLGVGRRDEFRLTADTRRNDLRYDPLVLIDF